MTKRRILLFQLTILVMGIAGAGRIRAADLLQTAEATFRNDNFEYEYKSASSGFMGCCWIAAAWAD